MKTSPRESIAKFFLGVTFIALAAGWAGGIKADQVKPWAFIANASQRFEVLASFDNDAVLDRATGLIWQREPIPTGNFPWAEAYNRCLLGFGNHLSYRLPTQEELTSLLVRRPLEGYGTGGGTASEYALPAGHPFLGLKPLPPDENATFETFWTATEDLSDSTRAYTVRMPFGGGHTVTYPKTTSMRYWCVRGGSNPPIR